MKKLLTIFVISIMTLSITACSGKENISSETDQVTESEEIYSQISWPDSDIAKLLPTPKSTIGKIEWEAFYGFVIYVADTPKSDYDTYVDLCKENGFDVNYQSGEDYYYADNSEGYHLSLNYEGNDVMFVRIDEPDENTTIEESDETVTESSEVSQTESPESSTESEATDASPDSSKSDDSIRPEFKEAMDSYEAFFDEYCEFMKKYKDSNNAASMLGDYTDYMTKYTDTMAKMSELGDDELSNEEMTYYAEVTARITKKLAEVAQ